MDYVAKNAIGMHCTIRVRVRSLKRYTDCNENRTEPPQQVAPEVFHISITPAPFHRYNSSLGNFRDF